MEITESKKDKNINKGQDVLVEATNLFTMEQKPRKQKTIVSVYQ